MPRVCHHVWQNGWHKGSSKHHSMGPVPILLWLITTIKTTLLALISLNTGLVNGEWRTNMPALDQCRPVSKFNLMKTEWSQYWPRTALDRMLAQHPLVSKRLTSYVVSLLLASCIFENNCRRFYFAREYFRSCRQWIEGNYFKHVDTYKPWPCTTTGIGTFAHSVRGTSLIYSWRKFRWVTGR